MGGRQGRARELQDRESALRSGLHPNTPSSVERFHIALVQLCEELRQLRKIEPEVVLQATSEADVEDICDSYWNDWEYNNSPILVDAKPYARQLHSALQRVVDLVDKGDAYANDALNLLSPEVDLNTSQRLDILEFWQAACTQVLVTRADRGRRRSGFLGTTVRRLADLWTDITGRKFSKTFSSTTPTSNRFKSENCQFVFFLVKAIAPKTTFQEVQTALRKMAN